MFSSGRFTPLFAAVLIGWIFSVCLHEFAHALVAYWGGDRTVRQRGYLSLNLFSYIDPIATLLIPAIILAIGGIPLPGAAVLIDTSRLRSRAWKSLVSGAGPIANLLLFALLAVILHPSTGLVDPGRFDQPMWVKFVGALCVLQLFGVFFNLLPIPPLDGYGIIEPYLPYDLRVKARRLGWWGLFIVVFVLFQFDAAMDGFMDLVDRMLNLAGLPFEVTWRQYNTALFGRSQ